MGIGDVICDKMHELLDEVFVYNHAHEEHFKATLLNLLTDMHQAISKVDWGDKHCTREQSRKIAEDIWQEKLDEMKAKEDY